MLKITIPGADYFDEATEMFVTTKEQTLTLEHSLVSISRWESKWHKPFLGKEQKTDEESIDYVRCMTITQNVDPLVYLAIPPEIMNTINAYVEDTMTATWFNDRDGGRPNREVVTSEIIYYWMVTLGIPFECEKWHLNRLLTLIRVCNVKNAPDKKMSRRDILSQNHMLNAARRRRMHTTG